MVDLKQKELGDVNRAFSEQKHALEDLNERLGASMQSCAESNELISRYDFYKLLVSFFTSSIRDLNCFFY